MRRFICFALAAMLCLQLLPGGVFAQGDLCAHHPGHDGDCGYGERTPCGYGCPICPVQDRIDALPGEVTADNADAVAGELDAIHGQIMALMESTGAADPGALLNLDAYNAAAEALSALEGQNGGAVDEDGTRTKEPMPAAAVGNVFYDAQSGLYFDVFTVSATALTGTVEVTYPREGEAAYNQISYNIPKTVSHDGITFTVTGIYGEAFKNCETLESVTIPDTVTTIGGAAFSGCSNLSSINIPDSVTTIEDMAFAYCTELDMLTIPASVTNIESLAFYDSNLKVMVWHDALKNIGENAFQEVSSVTHKLVTPTGLAYDSSAIAGNGVAFWNTNGTASGYNVYIYDSTDGTVAKWTTNVANDTSEGRNHLNMGDFLAKQEAPSGTYYFSVQAYGGFSGINGSEWSKRLAFSYVKGAPPEVRDVTLTRRNEVSATLTFTVSEDCTLYYSTAYADVPKAPDTTGTCIACTAGPNTVTITGISKDPTDNENNRWFVGYVLKDASGNCTDQVNQNMEKWTHQYSLTYETNGGMLRKDFQEVNTYTQETKVTLTTASRSNYLFKGWNTAADGSGTSYNEGTEFTVTGNDVLYAQWELVAAPADMVTVTFQMNGHGEAIPSQTVTAASKATEPAAPTADGYTFGGWYTDADCTTEYNFDTPVTQDITLYAKWEEEDPATTQLSAPGNPVWEGAKAKWDAVANASGYSLQLYKDGQPQGVAVTVATGTSHTFPEAEASGCSFKVKALGTGSYADSPEVESLILLTDTNAGSYLTFQQKYLAPDGYRWTDSTSGVTITAINQHQVNISKDGNFADSVTFTEEKRGAPVYLKDATGTVKYVYFVKCRIDNVSPSGIIRLGSAEQWGTFTTSPKELSFSEAQTLTILVYDAESDIQSVQYYVTDTAAADRAALANVAWTDYTAPISLTSGRNIVYARVTDNVGNALIINSAAITVEIPISFTVTFDTQGHGTTPDSQTVISGETATRPADPTADGYTFGGWYTEATCTNLWDFDTPVTGNLTLYAQWTKIDTDDTDLETRIEQSDITEVPEGLQNTAFNTVETIVEELTRVLTTGTGYASGNVATYDVKLQYSTDGGNTWITATEENFPTEGITVLLPYPDGTGRDTHDFMVTHMFTVTSQRLGTTAGETEEPPITKGEDGIQVTLNGLSPVGISWKSLETEEPQKPHKPWHRDWDNPQDRHDREKEYDSDSPKTGDTTQNGLWLTLAAVGLLGLMASLSAKKWLRKKK